MVAHGLAPVPPHFWAAAFFFCSLALLASFTLGPISHVLPPWLPAVFPGTWSHDGSGSDSFWSWCQCCFLSRLARLAAAQAHPLPRASPSLPACPAAAAAPRGGGCTSDGKWRLASLSWQFSASSHLPRLEPQRWVCGVVGSDAWFLFWAVHTLEELREALTHADLMILDVSAFVLLWYPYAKSLHGFLWKLPGCWEKSRAACVNSYKQQPSTCQLVFIVRGKKGRISLIWEMSLRNSSNLFLGIILH